MPRKKAVPAGSQREALRAKRIKLQALAKRLGRLRIRLLEEREVWRRTVAGQHEVILSLSGELSRQFNFPKLSYDELSKLAQKLRRLALEKALDEADVAYAPVVTDWIAQMVRCIALLKAKAEDVSKTAQLARSRLPFRAFKKLPAPDDESLPAAQDILDWLAQAPAVYAIVKAESEFRGRYFQKRKDARAKAASEGSPEEAERVMERALTPEEEAVANFDFRTILLGARLHELFRKTFPAQQYWRTKGGLREGGPGLVFCAIVCEWLGVRRPKNAVELYTLEKRVKAALPKKKKRKARPKA